MSTVASSIIGGCWLLFIVYWIFSATRLKAIAKRQSWIASLKYKIPTIIGGILLFRPLSGRPWQITLTPRNEITAIIGAALCIFGVGFAIWARRTLAGNWSSNVTFKQGHELIKTGPYRFARHPIYTGLFAIALGVALANGRMSSWLGLGLFFLGFWIKLEAEELVMIQHFPDQYPTYRREVKAVVPFVL